MKIRTFLIILLILMALPLSLASCQVKSNKEDVYLFFPSGSTYEYPLSTLSPSLRDATASYQTEVACTGGVYAKYGATTIPMLLVTTGSYIEFQDVSGTYHTTHLSYKVVENTLRLTTYVAGEDVKNFTTYIDETPPKVTLTITNITTKKVTNLHIAILPQQN